MDGLNNTARAVRFSPSTKNIYPRGTLSPCGSGHTPVAARHSTLNNERSRFRYSRRLLVEWSRGLAYPVKDSVTRIGSTPVVGAPGQWWEGPGRLPSCGDLPTKGIRCDIIRGCYVKSMLCQDVMSPPALCLDQGGGGYTRASSQARIVFSSCDTYRRYTFYSHRALGGCMIRPS